ncbi:alpha/beta hydrolase [Tahibacter sp.]|uniref:alpha/beta hydrolase n=1 Tax=Tahibacter sp. TaxID=2056211 RepID=UPI0028C379D9|nr:alpha/beta hydrolase [Tahibacter sp.]
MRTLFRACMVMLALPLLCACQAAFFRTVNTGHDGIEASAHTYSAEHDLKLDVYRPPNADRPLPVALFFYGGSWRNGERGGYAFAGRALAANGVLTVIADYRKYPAGTFPIFEFDSAAAARWTVDHAAELGGDPRRIFLVGHSAGAHIAALLATDAHYLASQGLKPTDFAGAIGLAGPYDFLPLTDPALVEVFGSPDEWPASQPVRFVDGDEPPFLVVQGDRDRIVQPRNAVSLVTALEQDKVPVTFRRYPNAGHFRVLAALRFTWLAPTLADVLAFVRSTPPASP